MFEIMAQFRCHTYWNQIYVNISWNKKKDNINFIFDLAHIGKLLQHGKYTLFFCIQVILLCNLRKTFIVQFLVYLKAFVSYSSNMLWL